MTTLTHSNTAVSRRSEGCRQPSDLDAELRRGLASLQWAERQAHNQTSKDQAAHIRRLLHDFVETTRVERQDQLREQIQLMNREIRAARARIRRLGGPGLATALIRLWARQQGHSVNSGGPVQRDIIDAFEDALGDHAQPHRRTIAIARAEADIATLRMRRTSAQGQLNRLRYSTPPTAVIRAWARAEGLDVPTTGRLPQHVIDAFNRQRPPRA
ncbi:Lsr2 family DNA-binding protein [Streptomyces sp. CA-106131]|uniref:Lsr2 family DNA-binding protein n=1 Tax=Streptomyces sp. CA-106131 TaxID=3240045 RepID=UPI003D8ACDED